MRETRRSRADLQLYPCLEWLPDNHVNQPFVSDEEYIDTHYQLLRANCLTPLAIGVRDYLRGTLDMRDMHVFTNVRTYGVVFNPSGVLAYELSFSVPGKRKPDFRNSLRHDSLLCISCDNFVTLHPCVIVGSDPELLRRGRVLVRFIGNHAKLLNDQMMQTGCNEAIAVESPVLFASFSPVLRSLSKMAAVPQSLADTLLRLGDTPQSVLSPDAVTGAIFELFSKRGITPEIPQLNAIILALTRSVALIQGPPGTGKTFVGKLIVELLLILMDRGVVPKSPILVVTYKNLALDQFLDGCLTFASGPGDVVRLGAGSESERLKKCTLRELKFANRGKGQYKFDPVRQWRQQIQRLRDRVKMTPEREVALSDFYLPESPVRQRDNIPSEFVYRLFGLPVPPMDTGLGPLQAKIAADGPLLCAARRLTQSADTTLLNSAAAAAGAGLPTQRTRSLWASFGDLEGEQLECCARWLSCGPVERVATDLEAGFEQSKERVVCNKRGAATQWRWQMQLPRAMS